MLNKTIWYSIFIIAILVTGICISGFIVSLAITTGHSNTDEKNKTTTVTNSASNSVQVDTKSSDSSSNSHSVLIMGDSLAKGTGDEKGLGFTNDYVISLKSKLNKNIIVTNIAVNGDKSTDLLQIVQNKQTWPAIENAQIIFISIGGNELRQFKNNEIPLGSTAIKDVQTVYLEDLRAILKIIRSKNRSCTIVSIGLYNPFDTNITPDKIKLLNTWNYETEQLLSDDQNSVFIPTYDLFKYNLQGYLSPDNFHPNSAGYAAISKRILETLK